MGDMDNPIGTLTKLSECLRGALDVSDIPAVERDALARGLAAYLAGSGSLDAALGIKPEPGQRDPRKIARLEMRDQMVAEIAQAFFADLHPSAQARELHTRWQRYQAVVWPRERALDAAPIHRTGKIEAALFAVMKVHDGILSQRSIRLILAASYPYSLPNG